MLLYRLLQYAAAFVSFFCVVTVFYWIYKAIQSKAKGWPFTIKDWVLQIQGETQGFFGKATTIVIVVGLIGSIITNTAAHQLVGIHNLVLLPEGTYCFFVEISPSYEDDGITLPAKVSVEKEIEDVGNDRSKTHIRYYVKNVFLPTGENIDIDVLEPAEIGESVYHRDTSGNEWSITLLNKHGYSPYVEESNNASWIDILLWAIETVPVLIVFLCLCKKEGDNRKFTSQWE